MIILKILETTLLGNVLPIEFVSIPQWALFPMSSRDEQNISSYLALFPTTCGLRIPVRYPWLLFLRYACKATAWGIRLGKRLWILAFLKFPYHGEPHAALNQCNHVPLLSAPMIKFISQSPCLVPSASGDRSSMLVRSLMGTCFPTGPCGTSTNDSSSCISLPRLVCLLECIGKFFQWKPCYSLWACNSRLSVPETTGIVACTG